MLSNSQTADRIFRYIRYCISFFGLVQCEKVADMVRILVVDDSATSRASLRSALEQRSEWVVVGEAYNGRHALRCSLKRHAADYSDGFHYARDERARSCSSHNQASFRRLNFNGHHRSVNGIGERSEESWDKRALSEKRDALFVCRRGNTTQRQNIF